ncbi:hypothetical protein [Chitinophaga nivalis]|uniref:3-oxoacyl-ACP synthase n=1 Tax=Chitinophaga nivalis TaxID=2991709 RepID=A0ABT3IR93_9BACT|nr:hypothetical protein [Chitinophaga nivalis]MCW3463914.1 hypothetical protein [Chitinophaga nivalis]MCW3486396.1 hypothetical protein [Chitinophaga nivalis]
MMNTQETIAFKQQLKQFCETLITQRIDIARAASTHAQQAANQEEKSSAGDKYETSRAMGHLEKDMYTRQLAENLKELARLQEVDTSRIYTLAAAGAVITCTHISFFIAAGLGKQEVDGRTIIFLSPYSPLAKTLQGKKAGDSFLFNKELLTITTVC